MSDIFRGEGWWMASDGKWYAPQLHHDPAYRAKYASVAEPAVESGEPAEVDQAEEAPTGAAAPTRPAPAEVEPEAPTYASPTEVEPVAPADARVAGVAERLPGDDDRGEPGGSDGPALDEAPEATGEGLMPTRVARPLEPDLADDTADVVAQAAPPPEIRWPDLPDSETSGESAREPDVDMADLPTSEPAEEDETKPSSEVDDEGWVSHGPGAEGGERRVSVAAAEAEVVADAPPVEADLPPSVTSPLGGPASRARLEVGRDASQDPSPWRAAESTVPMAPPRLETHLSATTGPGLTEIRVYKEPTTLVDRAIAAVIFLAGVGAIVGTFLNWVTENGVGTTGWERGDGLATVVAGVLGAAAAGPIFVGFRHIVPKTVTIVAGLVGAVVVGLVGVDTISDTSSSGTSLAVGFWLVLVSSVIMILAGFAERTSIT